MKKSLLFLLLLGVSPIAYADSNAIDPSYPVVVNTEVEEVDTYEPCASNYTSLIVELAAMDFLIGGSRNHSTAFPVKTIYLYRLLPYVNAINFSLLYAIPFHDKSRFAFCAGLGHSTLCYYFNGKKTGNREKDSKMIFKSLFRTGRESTECNDIGNKDSLLSDSARVTRSSLSIPYIDLLLRIRYSALKDSKDGFHGWVGFNISMRHNSFTRIEYFHYEESASLKQEDSFGLRRIAAGAQLGMGYNRFGLLAKYSFTSLFEKDQVSKDFNTIQPFSVAIYIDFFS